MATFQSTPGAPPPGGGRTEVPHLRKRLIALLADDRLDGQRLFDRLVELRRLETVDVFAPVLRLLAHVDLPEPEAESALRGLIDHRDEIGRRLGRDPGLRVAAFDYLANIRRLLRNPTVIETDQFERMERSAEVDELTGVFNRRYFRRALDRELRRERRHGQPTALILFDLDAFKPVNDLYGHPFGDKVLRRTAREIRSTVRDSDLTCRIGGEEFAVILPETDRLGAWAVGERVRRRVQGRFASTPVEGRAVTMTVSAGIACHPGDAREPSELVELADRALYRSKINGRNRVTPYHDERRRGMRLPVPPGEDRVTLSFGASDPVCARAIDVSRSGGIFDCATAGRLEAVTTVRCGDGTTVASGRVVRIETDERGAPRLIAVEFDDPLDLWFEPRFGPPVRRPGRGERPS